MTSKSNVVAMTSRRRLTDLYVLGKSLELNDDTGDEPIEVWISKINPLENREAGDKASAARAAFLSAKFAPDNDPDRIVYLDQLNDFRDRDQMVEFLAYPKIQESKQSHEAELASEDRWAKDNYYNSLVEAWNGGVAAKYEEDPKDPEAKKVFSELTKYANEVEKRVDSDKVDILSSYDIKTDEEIRREVIDRLIETDSDYAWLAELRKWQVYYAVREPEDHKRRYFFDKGEVDALDPQILGELVRAFVDLQVEATEGKGSEETPSS